MSREIITIGSQTKAIRAQRVLRKSGIQSELIKETNGITVTPRGCQYALRLEGARVGTALRALEAAGVGYIDYSGTGY